MKHKKFGKKLNRDIKKRKALFKGLISSLVKYGKIKTTLARAKAIRGLVDKVVTLAKDDSEKSKRQMFSFFNQKNIVEKLRKEIAPRLKDKVGGYVRIIKAGRRRGDNAEEVLIEWSVSKKVLQQAQQGEKKKKSQKKAKDRKKTKQAKKKEKKTTRAIKSKKERT